MLPFPIGVKFGRLKGQWICGYVVARSLSGRQLSFLLAEEPEVPEVNWAAEVRTTFRLYLPAHLIGLTPAGEAADCRALATSADRRWCVRWSC